jgi:hypothetical protein
MEYGVIYIKICPPIGHPFEWIKYCYIFDFIPTSLQNNIKQIANDINTKYSDDIIIHMDVMLHPGCTTTSQKVQEIATDMFNQYNEMMTRQDLPNCIRCVYSIGELSDIETDSTHHLSKKGGGAIKRSIRKRTIQIRI